MCQSFTSAFQNICAGVCVLLASSSDYGQLYLSLMSFLTNVLQYYKLDSRGIGLRHGSWILGSYIGQIGILPPTLLCRTSSDGRPSSFPHCLQLNFSLWSVCLQMLEEIVSANECFVAKGAFKPCRYLRRWRYTVGFKDVSNGVVEHDAGNNLKSLFNCKEEETFKLDFHVVLGGPIAF